MREERNLLQTGIPLDDLNYSSPGNKYSFEFTHIEKGIFVVKSRGYADDNSIKVQIQTGTHIRKILAQNQPEAKFHLIWDMSEVKGASIKARYTMMRHAASGTFASVSAVGANNLAKSYIKIIKSLIPHLQLFIYNDINEALAETIRRAEDSAPIVISEELINPETNSYASFIDLWQKAPNYYKIGEQKLKQLQFESWKYVSQENNFNVELSLLEGYIITIKCEGFIKKNNIDHIYQILEEIMDGFGYVNSSNKFYTILDLKKVKGITLGARKQTNFYEIIYKDRAHLVIMLPSPILHFALKVQKRINRESFGHWIEQNNYLEALELINDHRKGQFSLENQQEHENIDFLKLPENREELEQLTKKLYLENKQYKLNQKEHIQRILEITGRMTWDESFAKNLRFQSDNYGPFTDVYNALSVVHDDFQEIIREKTEHVQMLKESEDKYWNLINLASDIIAVWQDGICKIINSRVRDVTGYTVEEAKKISPMDFLPKSDFERLYKLVSNLKNNETTFFETSLIDKKGKEIPVSVSVGAITFEKKPARMYIVRDITAKKIAESELEKYRTQLELMVTERTNQLEKEILERESAERSDRLKSAFLSNMSHEIRTPMNAIIAFSNYLRNKDISQEQREEYINYIQSSGESLLTLINDIIDISKIEAKQINIQKVNCSINPILEELYTVFENTRKIKGCSGFQIRLIKNLSNSNPTIHTDPYRLKQILSNLLHNAMKFTEKGIINFGYDIKEEHLVFFVKDTGVGIPSNKIEFIFERFGKIETYGNKGGAGLGLAISQNLAKLLGGELTVESVLGQGSTFYLSIPFQGDSEELGPREEPQYVEKKSLNWEGKKILIAEDEDLNFKVLQIALKNTQVEIIRALNGSDAVEIVLSNPDINLVLMDIQMPLMDGYEALNRIKQLNFHIPIIAQTAFAMVEEKNNCLRLGFNDYISKPIDIPELLMKIDKFIL